MSDQEADVEIDAQALYERMENFHSRLEKQRVAFHEDMERHREVEHARQSELIGEILDALMGERRGPMHGHERDSSHGIIDKVEANSRVLKKLEGHLDNGGVPSKVKLSGGQWAAIIGAVVTGTAGVTVAIINMIAELATHS